MYIRPPILHEVNRRSSRQHAQYFDDFLCRSQCSSNSEQAECLGSGGRGRGEEAGWCQPPAISSRAVPRLLSCTSGTTSLTIAILHSPSPLPPPIPCLATLSVCLCQYHFLLCNITVHTSVHPSYLPGPTASASAEIPPPKPPRSVTQHLATSRRGVNYYYYHL